MTKRTVLLLPLSILLIATLISGYILLSKTPIEQTKSETSAKHVSFVDGVGRTISLTKTPERVVVLTP
ncbi:MAG: hypothetical protein DRO11_05000, partial [Methanobacteriota archaeon]